MANESNLQEILRQGVEAARKGDRIAARRLLQQALLIDRNDETALMWMASVVETVSERRQYLERVLRINPNNERAQQALQRLGGTPPAPAARTGGGSASSDANTPRRPQQDIKEYVPRLREDRQRQSAGINVFLVAAVVIGLFLVIIVVANLTAPQPTQQGDTFAQTFTAVVLTVEAQTPGPGTLAANAALGGPTPAPVTLPPGVMPTETPFFGIIVTFDPNQRTLPPTFTPTYTPTPTITPTPTETPLPLSSFRMLFTEFAANAPAPDLFTISADGTNLQPINGGTGASDAAVSPDGQRVAFVRGGAAADSATLPTATPVVEVTASAEATPELVPMNVSSVESPQIFVGAVNDGTFTPITALQGTRIVGPVWSPDGARIAFASNQDGDFDVYVINSDGTNLRQLTDNDVLDTAPSWSPDGAQIAFVSEVDSPSFTEIYLVSADGGAATRLTDRSGSSYTPVWSPDGTRIAYVNDGSGDSDVYVMDADGQRPFLLTIDDGGAEDRAPAWTPDGRYVAFATTRGNGIRFQLYLVDLTGTAQPVAITPGSIASIAFFR